MNKREYMEKNGLTIREATQEDRARATTDFQRNARYVIGSWVGAEWYSDRGTMKDLQAAAIAVRAAGI